MSFPATKRSECPRCDEGVKVGEPIEQNTVTRAWQHVECPPPKPKPVCPTCFMELPLSGECGVCDG